MSRAALAVLIASLAAPSLIFGVKTAGGSDSLGYVSEAYLWLAGHLHVPYTPLATPGIPKSGMIMTTLGYALGQYPGTLVPTYPPGVPLLMAVFLALFGTWGPFLVTPIASGLLVAATYLLGKRYADRPTGLLAALLVAVSPAVVFASMWPMSDVVAAALWTLVLVVSCRPTIRGAASAGAIAGLAVLVRPNLAPLVLLAPICFAVHGSGKAAPRLLAYAGGGLPFAAILGSFNYVMYGAVHSFGYGPLQQYYSRAHIPLNAVNYPGWFLESQGTLCALVVSVALLASLFTRGLRVLVLVPVLVAAVYAPYQPWDAWWYLRFMIPAYPALFVLSAHLLLRSSVLLPRRLGHAAVAAIAAVIVLQAIRFTVIEQLYLLHRSEQRYAAAGTWVRENLPVNAGLLAMQHSGSVRFYSGRMSFRYDWIARGDLWRIVGAVVAAGYDPYVVVDDAEEDALRSRFRPEEVRFLEGLPVAELRSVPRVRIYRLTREPWFGEKPVSVPVGAGRPVAPARRPPMRWETPAAGGYESDVPAKNLAAPGRTP